MFSDYVVLGKTLVSWVRLFFRNRKEFLSNSNIIFGSFRVPQLKIEEKYLTEEFLNGKPYSYEKVAEIAVDSRGNVYKVEDLVNIVNK